jgi:hypothetical protein
MIGFRPYIKKSAIGISGKSLSEKSLYKPGIWVLGVKSGYSTVPEGKKYTQYDTVPHSQSEIPFFS